MATVHFDSTPSTHSPAEEKPVEIFSDSDSDDEFIRDLGTTIAFDSLLEDERDYSQYHKNAIHLGWLKKKKIKKNWKKRFVVLMEDRIHYYAHPTQEAPLGVIPITYLGFAILTTKPTVPKFMLVSATGLYIFAASSEKNLILWQDKLREAASRIHPQTRLLTLKDFSTTVKKKPGKTDEIERRIIENRARVFQDWMNIHLKKRDAQVLDFRKDLFDGRLLMMLLEILFQRPLLPMVEVESEFQAINNITIVLDIFRNEGGTVGSEVTAGGIVRGDLSAILGLLWSIIMFTSGPAQMAEAVKRDYLLNWCKNCAKNSAVEINDFATSFADGFAFAAILNGMAPGTVDTTLLGDNHAFNLEIVFAAAEEKFHVPRLLFGNDFLVEKDGDDMQSTMWMQNELSRVSIGSRLQSSSEIRRASVVNNQSNINSISPPVSPHLKPTQVPTPRKTVTSPELSTSPTKIPKEKILVDEMIAIPYLFLLLAKAPHLEKESEWSDTTEDKPQLLRIHLEGFSGKQFITMNVKPSHKAKDIIHTVVTKLKISPQDKVWFGLYTGNTQIDDEEYVLQAAQFTFDEKKFVFKRINRTPSVSAPKKSVWKPIETTKRPPRNSLS
jgi:hypothetical protein